MSAVSKICTFDITGEERRCGPFSQCKWCQSLGADDNHSICPACRDNCHDECATKRSTKCAETVHLTCPFERDAACVGKYAKECMGWKCNDCKTTAEILCHNLRRDEHNDGKHDGCHKDRNYNLAYGCYYQREKCVKGLHDANVMCPGRLFSMICAKKRAAACAAKGHIECGFGDGGIMAAAEAAILAAAKAAVDADAASDVASKAKYATKDATDEDASKAKVAAEAAAADAKVAADVASKAAADVAIAFAKVTATCADWNFTSDEGRYYCDCGAGEMKDVKCCLSKKRNTDDDECISPKKQKTEHDPFPKSLANFYATFHLPSTKIKKYACSPDTYVKNFIASNFPRLHNDATLKLIYKTNDDCSHDVSDDHRFSDANEFWFEKQKPKEEPNE